MPPLFVYGLLRPGEVYWPELEPAVVRRTPACVRGRLFHHASGRYPLLELPEDGSGGGIDGGDGGVDEGWVLGEHLTLEATPAAQRFVVMELTAGYEARWVDVRRHEDTEPLGAAVTFVWPWGADQRGARIPSGDWRDR